MNWNALGICPVPYFAYGFIQGMKSYVEGEWAWYKPVIKLNHIYLKLQVLGVRVF